MSSCHPTWTGSSPLVQREGERKEGRESEISDGEGGGGRNKGRSVRKRGGKKGGMEGRTVFAFKLIQANLVSLNLGTWLRSTSKDDTSV